MKVMLVTQSDPFYIPCFFRKFSEIFDKNSNIEIVGIVIQDSLGDKGLVQLVIRMWNFYGPIDFCKQGFRYFLFKFRNLMFQFGFTKKSNNIAYYASKVNSLILPFSSMNSYLALEFIQTEKIDLIVSISASEIFKEKILSSPKLGCINMHNAPLPKYRGMLPNFWQMYHDEEYSVLTIHTMTSKIDDGKIIYQQSTDIKPGYSFDDLAMITKERSALALWKVLGLYKNNNITLSKIPHEKGSYFTFPTKSDVRSFKNKKKRLI